MMSRPSSTQRWGARVAASLLLLIVGIWLGGHPSWLPGSLRSVFVEDSGGSLVNQALDIVTRDYYRQLNRNALLNRGISAMVTSLNDPYSHYYDPAAYRSFLDQSNPHLSGVGIDVVPDPSGLRVVDVFPRSPAARAGLVHGDLIVKVGGTSLSNRSADFASRLIRGPAGTHVVLTVMRGHSSRVVSIVRAKLAVPVASGTTVTYKGIKIGDLSLTAFTDGSGTELRADVQKVLRSGARALILDLRENGGGLLDEAVNVASIFIPDGTIVSTAGRSQPRQVYMAKGNAVASKVPMVVLVDRDTASAAEIVAGALKDRGRATVVGTHTYGKGVFQEIEPLTNGGALDITVGEYFTPNGQNLGGGGVREGGGIAPNVYALDNPHTPGDQALTVAERTVAAKLR
jgi:carboxyl-terminal processing protease